MKIQPVRGTRDFYPQQMAVRNWISDVWRRVSLRHGFQEYDGPIFEYLELYTAKSGQEIVDQLFHLTDRGGRKLAIRPEMTPTLARMIAARIQSLPRPIKWFSISRLCRGERPQRGRLREFFQWNLDIVGADEPLADAECIVAAVDSLREFGLGPADVVVKINDRRLMVAIFDQLGIPADAHEQAFALLDKATRLDPDHLAQLWNQTPPGGVPFEKIQPLLQLQGLASLSGSPPAVLRGAAVSRSVDSLRRLFDLLESFGVSEFCDFDARIVRGLAYYTGPVYEAFDRAESLRALLGGGRYDNLLASLGGPAISGTGMGMGDVVLLELLGRLGRLPQPAPTTQLYLIDADPEMFNQVVRTAAELRRRGWQCEFSYKRQSLAKQLAAASARQALRCAIFGQETRQHNQVTVKDLASGRQCQIPLTEFLQQPMKPL
ncbi:MAG: histidine--tRNA ligase [Phycisphaerae bacterium]